MKNGVHPAFCYRKFTSDGPTHSTNTLYASSSAATPVPAQQAPTTDAPAAVSVAPNSLDPWVQRYGMWMFL